MSMDGSREAERVLARWRRLLVVGCSGTRGKDAHEIPWFMSQLGYDVVPVNPNRERVFGRVSWPSLAEVPPALAGPQACVVVFRPSPEAPRVAREAAAAGAGALWLQSGIAHPEARRVAADAGMAYVEDACLKVVAQRTKRL